MGTLTNIQWTDHTWNPWRGCTKVSPGCANCYAEREAKRNPLVLGTWGPEGRRSLAAPEYLKLPYRWNAEASREGVRRKVFALSFGDWLERREDLAEPRANLLTTIQATPNLDWLLLTKRPDDFGIALLDALNAPSMLGPRRAPARRMIQDWLAGRAPANVWSGVSVEDRTRVDLRYEAAITIPAEVRFFSCEPLLGPIWFPTLRGIHWVILGGESGPEDKVRPCSVEWIRMILVQCLSRQVAAFVKQLGSWVETVHEMDPDLGFPGYPSYDHSNIHRGLTRVILSDPKGGDPDEWPEDLRVREFPR